ncbi:MAG: NAD(P)-dependent oxidoreductase [Marinobacter sp.]|nr:NAD(P)-dependent oxidoreductase [Marinobacter sp.]
MIRNIGFIGLGVMGYPMAGHLADRWHSVNVFNRTPERTERWQKAHNGKACSTIVEAINGCDFVITCVGADPDLTSIYLGSDGIIANARPGSILIDHTTASAAMAEQLAEAARARDLHFIDAPVSGGQPGAEKGQLTIMCGGTEKAFETAKPVMEAYGKAVNLMGPSGAGQRTKMVNQIAVAGLLQALSEALNFAQQAGLDTAKVLDVISKGAAQSWQMDNRGESMLAGHFDHGFAVNWMRKDLAICMAEAEARHIPLPITALVDSFYEDIQAMGGGRWDTSSLIERLRKPT